MAPLGLALPLSVTVVGLSSVTALVVTSGTPMVVNDSTAPNDVPSLFDAIAQ